MPKRITFQADRDSTICEIDNYCRAKKLLAQQLFQAC